MAVFPTVALLLQEVNVLGLCSVREEAAATGGVEHLPAGADCSPASQGAPDLGVSSPEPAGLCPQQLL